MKRVLSLVLSVPLAAQAALPARSQDAAKNIQPSPATSVQLSQPHVAAREGVGGRVKVPAGIVVEVESPYTLSSQLVRKGDRISFRVVNPVRVSGAVVIEQGATATGVVTKASRGGHWGRAGRLAWEMQEVTAADGTRLPLQAGGRLVGDSKGAKVATQTVLVGVLLGPFAPLSLLHGMKRGENAYLPAGKRYEVFVSADTFVAPPAPPPVPR